MTVIDVCGEVLKLLGMLVILSMFRHGLWGYG